MIERGLFKNKRQASGWQGKVDSLSLEKEIRGSSAIQAQMYLLRRWSIPASACACAVKKVGIENIHLFYRVFHICRTLPQNFQNKF